MIGSIAAVLGAAQSVCAQTEVPEGFELIEIVAWPRYAFRATINNCGELAFTMQLDESQDSQEIFRYDNGSLVRLTHDDYRDKGAKINDDGDIVWARRILPPSDDQIILWQDGREAIIDAVGPDEMTIYTAINNLGWVAWGRGPQNGCNGDAMLWDGRSVRRISKRDDDRWNLSPSLNDLGDMVWSRMNVCVNPWNARIQLWSDGKRSTLPSAFTQLQNPEINDRRQITWSAAGERTLIELWSDGRTRVLTDRGLLANINDLGDVIFNRTDDAYGVAQIWLYRAADGRFMRLVDDPDANHTWPDISEWGEAVWEWGYGPPERWFGIIMMRRIRTGDSQFDGVIDAIDYATLADCLTGPGRVDRLCDCRFLDLDCDGDVDLGDFARFQNAFQGR
ncbi:MAG: hypothetical protein C4547_13585 [Phycisphaerales bacterium]|nr:MAG: hypothetical protein C4547_13585 [Phycisphaerales bacterium]